MVGSNPRRRPVHCRPNPRWMGGVQWKSLGKRSPNLTGKLAMDYGFLGPRHEMGAALALGHHLSRAVRCAF